MKLSFPKLALTLAGVIFLALGLFNARLGFGAQTVDCIDAAMSLVRFKTPETIKRGDFVVFVTPRTMGGRFVGHLAIKKVGAVAGDRIDIADGVLYINGQPAGQLDIADKAAKELNVSTTSFNRHEIVPMGSVFMIGTKPRTYDSRYWGFVPVKNVVGNAYPLI